MDITSMSPVDQIKTAVKAPLPLTCGSILGALVPIASYVNAHEALPQTSGWLHSLLITLVAGGLAYSAITVFSWAYAAFAFCNKWIRAIKSLGFVVLVEGTMTFSPITWLAVSCLVVLILINAFATGATLGLQAQKPATVPAVSPELATALHAAEEARKFAAETLELLTAARAEVEALRTAKSKTARPKPRTRKAPPLVAAAVPAN